MEPGGKQYIVAVMVWMMISPTLFLTIDVSAASSPETSVMSSEGYFSSNGDLHVRNATTLTFEIVSSTGLTTQGEYWYTGVISGNGSFQHNSSIIFNSEYEGNITLTYASNDGINYESNKSTIIFFDLSQPIIQTSSTSYAIVQTQGTSQNSQIEVTSSENGTVQISCNDSMNPISNITLLTSNGTILHYLENSTSIILNGSAFPLNQTTLNTIECTDKVGNTRNRTLRMFIDNQAPILQIIPSFSTAGLTCINPSWNIATTISDSTPPLRKIISIDNGATWLTLQSPYTPPLNFSGSIQIRGYDGVENFNSSTFSFPGFDTEAPQIQIGRAHV